MIWNALCSFIQFFLHCNCISGLFYLYFNWFYFCFCCLLLLNALCRAGTSRRPRFCPCFIDSSFLCWDLVRPNKSERDALVIASAHILLLLITSSTAGSRFCSWSRKTEAWQIHVIHAWFLCDMSVSSLRCVIRNYDEPAVGQISLFISCRSHASVPVQPLWQYVGILVCCHAMKSSLRDHIWRWSSLLYEQISVCCLGVKRSHIVVYYLYYCK